MLNEVIDLLVKYNLSIIYDDSKIGKAMGIGDLLFNILVRQNNLVDEILYLNVIYFADSSYYPNPLNALEFRIKLLKDLASNIDNIDINRIKFIYSNNKYICQEIPYSKLYDFKLNIKPEFFNNCICLFTDYIIFHTKCRFSSNFDYVGLKNQLGYFFSNLKTKYKIIILGEQTFPHTIEVDMHGFTTIYDELILLSKNNSITDLTKKEIYNQLNYESYKNDLFLIKNAIYNIHIGYGGQLCSSLTFGKTIYYSTLDFFNQESLLNNQHYNFSNLQDFFVCLTNTIGI